MTANIKYINRESDLTKIYTKKKKKKKNATECDQSAYLYSKSKI